MTASSCRAGPSSNLPFLGFQSHVRLTVSRSIFADASGHGCPTKSGMTGLGAPFQIPHDGGPQQKQTAERPSPPRRRGSMGCRDWVRSNAIERTDDRRNSSLASTVTCAEDVPIRRLTSSESFTFCRREWSWVPDQVGHDGARRPVSNPTRWGGLSKKTDGR